MAVRANDSASTNDLAAVTLLAKDFLHGEVKEREMDSIEVPYTCLEPTAVSNLQSGIGSFVQAHAEQHEDLELLIQVLWRRIAALPSLADRDLESIEGLLQDGGDALECSKLLAYSNHKIQPSDAAKTLQNRIYTSVVRCWSRTLRLPLGVRLLNLLSRVLCIHAPLPSKWQAMIDQVSSNTRHITVFAQIVAACSSSEHSTPANPSPNISPFERYARAQSRFAKKG
ncbi:hypothetical protein LTR22_025134 [Elasticomyces elasticus]|nr:hypothetical protein LTR22_025134 [Elasticomyces elasticus]